MITDIRHMCCNQTINMCGQWHMLLLANTLVCSSRNLSVISYLMIRMSYGYKRRLLRLTRSLGSNPKALAMIGGRSSWSTDRRRSLFT